MCQKQGFLVCRGSVKEVIGGWNDFSNYEAIYIYFTKSWGATFSTPPFHNFVNSIQYL